jgi:hypothetical protein
LLTRQRVPLTRQTIERRPGLKFISDAPYTNAIGQQMLYFDTSSSMRSRMHLTQLPV